MRRIKEWKTRGWWNHYGEYEAVLQNHFGDVENRFHEVDTEGENEVKPGCLYLDVDDSFGHEVCGGASVRLLLFLSTYELGRDHEIKYDDDATYVVFDGARLNHHATRAFNISLMEGSLVKVEPDNRRRWKDIITFASRVLAAEDPDGEGLMDRCPELFDHI